MRFMVYSMVSGIINDHLINLRHIIMNEEDKDLLMKTPSTILGSSPVQASVSGGG